ncbi:lipopolysaccharide biosynthesis protein [Neobacillus cucumis]|uniref:lipopolysaccharide biosynthesis protein n=1 Tax=Neobacillus cucumis TaxID=1740721 RepID=UPI002E213292|nr:oligosaccharide flippase family protein [Neobacillus cucumis]MED4224250.1 polysaccharide biosynthesis C-terminal domain-containing protein [Neobacillus cucumis]
MSVYSKLLKNSMIFAIGNLGTKLISFVLVPIYTFALSKGEFGSTDLVTTTISLLLPLISLSIYDALLRFSMDKGYSRPEIFSNGIIVVGIGFLFSIALLPLFNVLEPFKHFIFYFYILLFLQLVNTALQQFVRGIGKVKLFAFTGIIYSLMLLISVSVLLITFKMGMNGYFISLIVSNLLSVIILFIFGDIKKYINFSNIKLQLTKEMLVYSVPLIPNAMMWWIMNASNRYMIAYFVGVSANGLFAVATKIPSMLNIINSIFFQAWQLSAIEEADSKNKSKFYSNVFNMISSLMFISTSILLVCLKFIMKFFVSDQFYDSWKYSPFLFLGVVFSCFSAFLGTNYIAAKDTKGVFKTSLVGALINIILNLILIPLVGVNGAAIATMVSFAVICYIRLIDTKKFVHIKIKFRNFSFSLFIIFIQIGLLYLNTSFEFLIQTLLFLVNVIINKETILIITGTLQKKLFKSRVKVI